MLAFLIHVQERQPRLEGGVLIATAGDQNIGLILACQIQQLPGIAVFDHLGILAHQGLDPFLVFLGRFLGASRDDVHP